MNADKKPSATIRPKIPYVKEPMVGASKPDKNPMLKARREAMRKAGQKMGPAK